MTCNVRNYVWTIAAALLCAMLREEARLVVSARIDASA
jgi:hypothetical protein